MSIFSVSDITKYIKSTLDNNQTLSQVFISGEISNFKRHYSGHCYFTLKDSGATLRAVMFKSRAQRLKFAPKDGLKVIAGGNITVFERDGQYQLYVEQLAPAGLGELSLAYAQLKEKLTIEGLFAEELKQPLPILPKTVGIITSPTGAALRDIVTVSKRRHPGISLILCPVQVQGAESPREIVRAIEIFNNLKQVDVIIVGRGGGSIEELWSFNDEKVVRAIYNSTVPIVSAVGHETDFTLSDFAADRRAATPSQAAELVVPDIRELQRYIKSLHNLLENNMRNSVAGKRLKVQAYAESRVLLKPEELMLAKKQQLDYYVERIREAIKKSIIQKKHSFTLNAEKLSMLNPLAVLSRGYSITQTLDKKVVTTAEDICTRQQLEVILSKGTLQVEVLGMKKEQAHEKS
ncbi:MAG: exodeoxyribonuclease VII large subunit [Pelosinus sp.]|nr:exodeoxyribonuclease VII large subunit [Pelosinus sp.]